jgi:hypothetical protein
MRKRCLLLALLFLLAAPVVGWPAGSPRSEEKGTFLGVLFSPVPEALYDQLPQLPRDQGVLVTYILPDSPASRANLRRHDILLRYDDERIRDCEHFARLIQADKPERKVKLALFRAGKETSAEVTLALGPVLRIAPTRPAVREHADLLRDRKTNAPTPSVSVAATPLEDGKMKVTIEYHEDRTGRLQTITCQGVKAEIDSQVKKQLPERECNLVQIALKRIRDLNSQKPEAQRSSQ